MIRDEKILYITVDMYTAIMTLTNKKPILKSRKIVRIDEKNNAVLDKYNNLGYNLATAEVEFDKEEDANNFKPPKWFGKEVTNDPNYKNKNLWKKINS